MVGDDRESSKLRSKLWPLAEHLIRELRVANPSTEVDICDLMKVKQCQI
jgi:hypothetical protein